MKVNQDSIDSCLRYLKIFIIIFSAVFLILGIIVLIVGCVSRSNFGLQDLESTIGQIHEGANILIFVGLLLVAVGIIGVLGAIKQNQVLLLAFFVLVFFAFSFLMAAGIWASAWKDKIGFVLEWKLLEYVKALSDSESSGTSSSKAETMNWIQKKLKCCGDVSSADYTGSVPKSCDNNHEIGCKQAIIDAFKNHIHKISALGITIGFFSIFGMVTSLTYCCALREV